MEKEIVITAEELFYLGRVLQAKYIDYAYVAAMNDIRQSYVLFEKETRNGLVASGYLLEDFSGNLEMDPQVKTILKPIFFGEVETALDICTLGETSSVKVNKFHFHDGLITYVTGQDGKLRIRCVDRLEIREMVEALLPPGYNAEAGTVTEVSEKIVTRFIAAKSILVGKTAVVKTYIESEDVFYEEDQDHIRSVNKETFVSDIYGIIKGV